MKDYLQPDASGYGSHIPVFQTICKYIQIKNAIEFGMGIFSTGFLLDNCEYLTSIEMQENRWCEDMILKFKKYKNWNAFFIPNELCFNDFNPKDYDFCLVDGIASTRAVTVNYFMQGGTETIMAHDTESTWYGWHHVKRAKGYFTQQFVNPSPATTIWTRNEALIKGLLNEV